MDYKSRQLEQKSQLEKALLISNPTQYDQKQTFQKA